MKREIRFLLSAIACFCYSKLTAQIAFEPVLSPSAPQNIVDFVGIEEGSIAFADVDGDLDQDVLITGIHSYTEHIARLYINDGQGNFIERRDALFEGVKWSSVAFADVDNDHDLDVLITGENRDEQHVTTLYMNDASGNFSEAVNTPFVGVANGSIAFTDVDNDQDQDVMITGYTDSSDEIAKLYQNDGNGNFSEVADTPFKGVGLSSVAFTDVDGDLDQDVLITGDSGSGRITNLYTNDGSGNFSEVADTPFYGVSRSSIAFADIDSDTDQDVLITGNDRSGAATTSLYKNDGSGNFSEVTNASFLGISNGSIAFADIDGDLDQDLLITGDKGLFESTANLYVNDGRGNFSEVEDISFTGVYRSAIAFADVDGDHDQDVLITGDILYQSITKLYINDGTGRYGEVDRTPFEAVYTGSVAFADIDGDHDQDALVTGEDSYGEKTSKLYKNDGHGNFSQVTATALGGVYWSSVAFADIDGDLDQDLLITGWKGPSTRLYKNDGSGNYNSVTDTPFENVGNSSVAFADVDGDLDQDVLISGSIGNGIHITKLYSNDGRGTFSEVVGTPFEGVDDSSVTFADVDGDHDQDLLITGENNNHEYLANLYINDGKGKFSKVANAPFKGVHLGTIDFADVDGDNDQDVLITGSTSSYEPDTRLYKNDGYGTFTEVADMPFVAVYFSSVAFADVDGDLDQDVLITGASSKLEFKKSMGHTTKLYENNGKGNFAVVEDLPFTNVRRGSIAFADVDGDRDQDVLITGYNDTYQRIAKLYRNNTPIIDRPPAFASADTVYVQENVIGIILDINAHDGNGGTDDAGITYRLVTDEDHERFKLATNGSVTFHSPPDYEAPQDTNGDNIYQIIVTASDGTHTTKQLITIVVADENDNMPVVSADQHLDLIKDATDGAIVGTVAATDIDTNTTFRDWTITSGNPDHDLDGQPAFSINDAGEVTVNDADDLLGTSGELQLEVTVNDGLFSSFPQTLTLEIKPEDYYCDIFIPNVFTPNDDGKNDLFQPVLHQRVQNPILRIYDRYGTLVYEDRTSAYWNGMLEGRLASAGSYYWLLSYICTQNNSPRVIKKKGWVTLLKNRIKTK